MHSDYETRIPRVEHQVITGPTRAIIPPRRQYLIDKGVVGITGHGLASGYRHAYTIPFDRLGMAFDDEIGALDAPDAIPAGSSRAAGCIPGGVSDSVYR